MDVLEINTCTLLQCECGNKDNVGKFGLRKPNNNILSTNVINIKAKHNTVYPKKYAHGFVVLCFVVVTQSFIMNSHEVFIHIHQGCFAGTGAIVRLPQCQLSKPDGYGKISQCITTTKHSKAKTVCIFLGIYCTRKPWLLYSRLTAITTASYRVLQSPLLTDRPLGLCCQIVVNICVRLCAATDVAIFSFMP